MLISEMFHSIQGEGYHAGRAAFFVRLPGCNLRCDWCDTDFKPKERIRLGDLKKAVKGRTFAVVTGGEPVIHPQFPEVIETLHSAGCYVAVESNGTSYQEAPYDWLTVSPKRFQDKPYNTHPKAFQRANEFKYVVDLDFDWNVTDRHLSNDFNYLQPEWSVRDRVMPKILEFIKTNEQWRLSLQTHKYLGLR